MELRRWMAHEGLTEADLGRLLGVSRQCVNNYLRRSRAPRVAIAKRIVKITKGEVALKDLYA